LVVEGGSLTSCSNSMAIYAGEIPGIHKIQNSIYIHIPHTDAALPARPEWVQRTRDRLPIHLDQYRDKNLDHVRGWEFAPSGVTAEMAGIAKALGSCIVEAPELRIKLVALLKTQGQQRRFENLGHHRSRRCGIDSGAQP
jgi:hypothetical protein